MYVLGSCAVLSKGGGFRGFLGMLRVSCRLQGVPLLVVRYGLGLSYVELYQNSVSSSGLTEKYSGKGTIPGDPQQQLGSSEDGP